jgi:hypothetical protein
MSRSKLLRAEEANKLSLIVKLLIYSFMYGLFVINIIDLTIIKFWGYNIFLIILYFIPFLIICPIFGFNDWELFIGLGLLSSLVNDLSYALIGNIFFHMHYNLLDWIIFQLGFYGSDGKYCWVFDGGFFKFQITSIIMGLSIYVRAVIVYLLLYKWYKKKET